MRKVLLTTLMALFCSMGFAQFSSNADIRYHNFVTINKNPINGYLEHLPPDYYSNSTKKFPVIVMLHGQSERGNGTTDLYKAAFAGPSYEAERNGKFCIDGECFIVISPQLAWGYNWAAGNQAAFWDYILNKKGYRYDPDRVYLTGLSLGGNGAWSWASSNFADSEKLAAIAVMAGWGNVTEASRVGQKGISTWAFHGTADPVIAYSTGKAMSDAVRNSTNPYGAEHKWKGFTDAGHNIWWMTYRMDEYYVSPNVYRWLAGKRRQNGSAPPPANNTAPTVNAGADITVPYSTGSASITASASDSDGSIVKYQWTKISGPAVSMWNTGSATLGLSNFASSGGTYEFQITVTDNGGATASDRVILTKEVSGSTGGGGGTNTAPTVSAGADITVPYNTGSASIQATASDPDGSIASYKWTKVSGPSVSMWSTGSSKLGLSNFAASGGTYVFKITVTDNDGAQASDQVTVYKEISGTTSTTGNKAPTVSAGADMTVPYSQGSASIQATASDSDGSIASYKWTKVSGPSVSMWSTGSSKLGLSNFASNGGTYIFRITVTDNDGATASDDVTLVKEVSGTSSGNNAPTVSAGPDMTVPYSQGSASIQASASDSDGTIASYKWTKVSGPSVSMWSTGSSKLDLSNFSASGGTYTFRITVTDNDGATAYDDVVLVKEISGSTSGSGITVSAGPDMTVDMYTGSALVDGSATDSNGKIMTYKWTKVSGPAVSMWSTNSPDLGLSNFDPAGGLYEFKLTVTDDDGNVESDIMLLSKLTTLSSSNQITYSINKDNGEFTKVQQQVEVMNYRTNGEVIRLGTQQPLRIIIMGINGVMVTDEKVNGSLDANILSNGMYIYRLVTEEGELIQKGRIIRY